MNGIDDMINEITGKIRYELESFTPNMSVFVGVDRPDLFVIEYEDAGTGA